MLPVTSLREKNNFRCDLSSLSSLYESVPCKWDVRCCSHERELVSAGSRSLFRRIHFLKKFRGNNFRSKPSLYMSQCMGRALLFPRAGVGFDRLPLTFSNEWALSEANFSGEKKSFSCDLSQLITLYKGIPCKWDVRCCSHERELVSANSRSLF